MEATKKEQIDENLIEIERCQDVIYFLTKYGKVRDKLKGVIPWEPWEHLLKYLEVLRTYRFVIVLKAKQIGATWTLGGSNLHLAMYQTGANVLTLSKGEEQATESLDYSRFMLSQLPDFLRLKVGKDQSSLITFPSRHSRLRALPSTEDAGVGFGGATRVALDEFEYHPHDRKNYAELLPPILAGGQMVIQSTADRFKMSSLFKELYVAAKHADNNFYPIFFPYDVLPDRTQDWYDSMPMAAKDKECRFPRNEDEALATSETTMFFSKAALDTMETRTMLHIGHEMSDRYPTVRIYKPPIIGERYYMATDASEGREDPHCIVIIDKTGEQVAESHGKTHIDTVAAIHDALARLYNADNTWESGPGGAGGLLTSKLDALSTPKRAPTINVGKRPFELDYQSGKKGWWTSGSLWDVGMQELEEAIRLHQITPHSIEAITEFRQIIQPEGDKPRKVGGGSDDYVDAWMRVWLLKKLLPTGTMRVKNFSYG